MFGKKSKDKTSAAAAPLAKAPSSFKGYAVREFMGEAVIVLEADCITGKRFETQQQPPRPRPVLLLDDAGEKNVIFADPQGRPQGIAVKGVLFNQLAFKDYILAMKKSGIRNKSTREVAAYDLSYEREALKQLQAKTVEKPASTYVVRQLPEKKFAAIFRRTAGHLTGGLEKDFSAVIEPPVPSSFDPAQLAARIEALKNAGLDAAYEEKAQEELKKLMENPRSEEEIIREMFIATMQQMMAAGKLAPRKTPETKTEDKPQEPPAAPPVPPAP
jgi:hypothetical protein